MVDALSEIWRCLRPGGTLIDIRPVAWESPLEIVTAENVEHVGVASDSGMDAEDAGADAAMATAVARGWFAPLDDVRFGFNFYWDSVDELATFVEENRRVKQVTPTMSEIENLFARTSADDDARLRCKRRVMLATYSRQAP